MRADAKILKSLLKAGVSKDWVCGWQRVPFFDIDPNTDACLDRVAIASNDRPLPYEDFVISMQRFLPNSDAILRIVEEKRLDRLTTNKAHYQKIKNHLDKVKEKNWTINAYGAAVLLQFGTVTAIYVAFCKKETGEDTQRLVLSEDIPQADREILTLSVRAAIAKAKTVLDQIFAHPKHLIEQRASNPKTGAVTAKLKPWLRDDLPTIVLMDPNDARAAGQPREVDDNEPRIGRHKRPHSRRAHWRRLGVADDGTIRKTFVRSCWIGPDEWMYEGRQYRVLKPAVNGD